MKKFTVLSLALFVGAIVFGVSGQSAALPVTGASEAVKSGVTPVYWASRRTYYWVRPAVGPRYVRPTVYLSPRYVRPTVYLSPNYVRPTVYARPYYVRPTYYVPYDVRPTYYVPYVVSPTLYLGAGWPF